MTAYHRRPTRTARKILPFVSIVLGLLMVVITYPRPTSDGVVMPPGQQGAYSNYDQTPVGSSTAGP